MHSYRESEGRRGMQHYCHFGFKGENDDFGCILKDLMKKHRLLRELV